MYTPLKGSTVAVATKFVNSGVLVLFVHVRTFFPTKIESTVALACGRRFGFD
jgi:hypothetical protein